MDTDEKAHSQLLSAGPVLAPQRAAFALGIEAGTPVIARRRLIVSDELGPVELGAAYLPVDLASGTDVAGSDPLPEGLLRHVAARKAVVFDHAAERISARLPTADEAELLQVTRREPLLTVLLSVCDRAGTPLIAVDVLLPATRHELEDVFPWPDRVEHVGLKARQSPRLVTLGSCALIVATPAVQPIAPPGGRPTPPWNAGYRRGSQNTSR